MHSTKKTSYATPKPLFSQPGKLRAWHWVSERGLLLTTGNASIECYETLVSRNLPEIEDVIPADGCILLVLRRGAGLSSALRGLLPTLPTTGSQRAAGKLHTLAVAYGGDAGPDLPTLAERAGLDEAAYVARHAAVEFTVAFLGFQPGFPYLRGLPDDLHAPRRASPRVRVAAGSVAVGGSYAGIYPTSGPGGWQIIGHTTACLFDPLRDAPALLMPGDRVRCVPA